MLTNRASPKNSRGAGHEQPPTPCWGGATRGGAFLAAGGRLHPKMAPEGPQGSKRPLCPAGGSWSGQECPGNAQSLGNDRWQSVQGFRGKLAEKKFPCLKFGGAWGLDHTR